jgi:N-acetylglucosamine-6-phosphate deacetylase
MPPLLSRAPGAAGAAIVGAARGSAIVELIADGVHLDGGTLLDQVRWLVRDLGIPLSDAVAAASTTPARALALTGSGSLAPGQYADLLVVDSQLVLHRVLRRGSWL